MSSEAVIIQKLGVAIGEALLKVPGALNRTEWAYMFTQKAGTNRVSTSLALELFLALDSATFTSLAHQKLQFEDRVAREDRGDFDRQMPQSA